MRRETEAKREQVRVQALLNVRDWLKAAGDVVDGEFSES
jgi:hypothetical protein